MAKPELRVAKTRDPETNKSINDKTTVIYNERVTIRACTFTERSGGKHNGTVRAKDDKVEVRNSCG